MFSYYGGKGNVIDLYPKPIFDKIIEPFAGSAKYSLKYFDKQVCICDKSETIINLWHFLQKCSPSDILSLPRNLKQGERLSDLNLSFEEKILMGFIIAGGAESPRNVVTRRKSTLRPNHINYHLTNIAASLFKIRHWEIICCSYDQLQNENATWFIDPPYQVGGDAYPEGSKNISFPKLSEWCISRFGQAIVCENTNANWLPFLPIKKQRGSVKSTTEAIWSNLSTAFDYQQAKLF